MTPFLTRAFSFLKRNILLVLFVLVVALFGIAFAFGFRPGPGLTFVRTGTLVLNLPAGATVYADETRRATGQGKNVRIALVPGNHSIIVDVPGDNPWNDIVTIEPHADTTIHPLFVPVKPVATVTTPTAEATAQLAAYKLPTESAPIVLQDGCTAVSVLKNRVVASVATSTCATPPAYLCVGGTCATTVVFAPVAPLRSVIPYPGREDALVVSYGDTIAVIELNPLKPQFFAPLVRGTAPMVIPYSDTSILVRDTGRTFSISL